MYKLVYEFNVQEQLGSNYFNTSVYSCVYVDLLLLIMKLSATTLKCIILSELVLGWQIGRAHV